MENYNDYEIGYMTALEKVSSLIRYALSQQMTLGQFGELFLNDFASPSLENFAKNTREMVEANARRN